jgi:hypothetical protein
MTTMRKMLVLAVAVFGLTSLTGCGAAGAFAGRTGIGYLSADSKMSEHISGNPIGSKTGEACSQSILGIVTTGDSTAVTAAKNGGIRKISTVDNKFQNILGIFSTYCVVVTGD